MPRNKRPDIGRRCRSTVRRAISRANRTYDQRAIDNSCVDLWEMGSTELSLSWDDHHKTLCGVFEELLESNTLVDCTIAAEGQYLKAHKLVLSACSPYFQILFSQENEKNPIVVLKDIKYDELRAIIDFVYRGKVNIAHDQLGEFLEVAESLQIKGLAHHKTKKLEENVRKTGLSSGQYSPVTRKRRKANSSCDEGKTEFQSENNSASCLSRNGLAPETSACSPKHSRTSSQASNTVLPLSRATSSASCGANKFQASNNSSSLTSECIPEAMNNYGDTSKICNTSSTTNALAKVESVVKTEPETELETEPDIPEFFEAKSEEYIDDIGNLDHDGDLRATTGDIEQRGQEYSAAFETPDDSFLVTQMADNTGVHGSESSAHLPPGSVPQPVPVNLFQQHPHSTSEAMTAVGAVNHSPVSQLATVVAPIKGQMQQHLQSGPLALYPYQNPKLLQPHIHVQSSGMPVQAQMMNHVVGKLWRCFVCDATFTNNSDLNAHKRVHLVRRFQCNACHKTFGRNGDLLIHRRLVCVSRKQS